MENERKIVTARRKGHSYILPWPNLNSLGETLRGCNIFVDWEGRDTGRIGKREKGEITAETDSPRSSRRSPRSYWNRDQTIILSRFRLRIALDDDADRDGTSSHGRRLYTRRILRLDSTAAFNGGDEVSNANVFLPPKSRERNKRATRASRARRYGSTCVSLVDCPFSLFPTLRLSCFSLSRGCAIVFVFKRRTNDQ